MKPSPEVLQELGLNLVANPEYKVMLQYKPQLFAFASFSKVGDRICVGEVRFYMQHADSMVLPIQMEQADCDSALRGLMATYMSL